MLLTDDNSHGYLLILKRRLFIILMRVFVLFYELSVICNSGIILKKGYKESYTEKDTGNMLFKCGEQVMSEYYTGKVYISDVAHQTKFDINHLAFAPNSRNTWHIHPDAEQVLLILDGEGYYQEEGQEVIRIKKGDVIRTPANVKHWHGSTSESRLVHLSITERTNKGHIEWIK